jgi:RCC1-like G exchanging factor-like protein
MKSKRSNLKVYVWGLAETGALGIQRSLKKHKQMNCLFVQHPSRLSFGEKYEVLDVSAGYGFSIFVVKSVDDNISLFGTGINTDSQIGYHKHRGVTNKPIEIMIYPAPIVLPKISDDEKLQAVKAATGRAHTVVLTDNGALFTLGNNAYGQCARPVIDDEEYFGSELIHRVDQTMFNNSPISDIVCGQDHTIFLTKAGEVYTCGWGADGQTGLGHYNNQHQPELVQGDIKGEKIVKLSSVGDCVLALNEKGEVFGWGNSEYGQISQVEGIQQINVPSNLKYFDGIGKITDIAAGGSFCAVLNEAGDVFVWGFGLLGFGPNVDYCKLPKLIPPTLFGRNSFNPANRVVSINCGLNHLAAVNSDNDLFTWGKNKFGCLGLGHDKDQFFPYKALVGAKVEKVTCGVDHTIAVCKSFV